MTIPAAPDTPQNLPPAVPLDTTQLAIRVTVLAVLATKVKEAADRARAELQAATAVGTTLRPALTEGGRPIGSISHKFGAAPRVVARVAHPDDFLDWVLLTYPEEVEVQVKPDFQARCIAASEAAGEPVGPGGELGVPILVQTTTPGAPTISVAPDKSQAAAVWAVLTSNPSVVLQAIEGMPRDPA